MTALPKGVFLGLPYLRLLGLSHNALTALPGDVFRGLSNLQILYLHGNDLTALPEGVFADSPICSTSIWVATT